MAAEIDNGDSDRGRDGGAIIEEKILRLAAPLQEMLTSARLPKPQKSWLELRGLPKIFMGTDRRQKTILKLHFGFLSRV